MKKIVKYAIIFFIIICCTGSISYYLARKNAKSIVKGNTNLSSLRGNLVLYIDNKLKPCWLFKAEHNFILTGGTFDIYVSFMGKIIKIPNGNKLKSD